MTASSPPHLAKSAPSLGHAVSTLLQTAQELLLAAQRSSKSVLSDELRAGWVAASRPLLERLSADSPFELNIGTQADVWWLKRPSFLEPNAWLLLCWMLHLPAMRSVWIMRLRASRYDLLSIVVPRVWRVVEEAPPPGTVIGGLGTVGWEEAPADVVTTTIGKLAWWSSEKNSEAENSLRYFTDASGRIGLAEGQI